MLFLLFILFNSAVCFSKNNNVSNQELRKISIELLNNLPTSFSNKIFFNYQGQIVNKTSEDLSAKPFINVKLDHIFESVPTIKLMHRLYDNYELEVDKMETKNSEKNAEEDEFIFALLETETMLHAMKFLADKGFIKHGVDEYKRILKLMWFQLYSRKNNIYGSSGFEHVYLAEKKNRNKIIGLHNWVYFAKEELSGRLNYFGYTRQLKLNDRVSIVSVQFTFDGIKKWSSFFIGTPPELEMAFYTICFFVKPGKSCRLGKNNSTFSIQTYGIKYGGSNLIGTAYPRI